MPATFATFTRLTVRRPMSVWLKALAPVGILVLLVVGATWTLHAQYAITTQRVERLAAAEGNPLVSAIERFQRENGRFPHEIQELKGVYDAQVHSHWVFWPDAARPELSYHFNFVDTFLCYDFERRDWCYEGKTIGVSPPPLPTEVHP